MRYRKILLQLMRAGVAFSCAATRPSTPRPRINLRGLQTHPIAKPENLWLLITRRRDTAGNQALGFDFSFIENTFFSLNAIKLSSNESLCVKCCDPWLDNRNKVTYKDKMPPSREQPYPNIYGSVSSIHEAKKGKCGEVCR